MKMKKKLLRSNALFLALILAVSAIIIPSAVMTEAVDSTTKSYQDQIAELNKKQAQLKKKIDSLKSDINNATAYKNNLDELSDVTQNKISAAEALTAELELSIANTEEQIAEKETAIEATFNKFLDRMAVSYEEGEASYLSILLGSEDMGDFLTKMDLVSSMLEYDRDLKNQYKSEKEDLEKTRESLKEAKTLQEETLAELEEDKAYYDALLEKQNAYISSLESDKKTATSAYEAAVAQNNELNNQLKNYLKSLQQSNSSSYVYDGNGFAWPLEGYSTVSSGYGWRTLGGVRDFHLGIDIPAPTGTPIHASSGGVVLKSVMHGSYGNYVLIDNGSGYSTLYAHMSRRAVSVGQTVTQGQVIGYVGTTGYVTGAHLHFEIRVNGETTNPLNYVRR